MERGGPDDSTVILPGDHRWSVVHPDAALSVAGFRILEKLGEGGMGAVYAAEQLQPQRLVALKVLTTGASADPYRQKLFAREIEVLARLHHPSIATIYGAGESMSGGSYFTMELVKGWRLDEYRGRGLARNDRIELFLQVCDAVSHAHQQGIIHRDLKPANVMVSENADGRRLAKVLDFGLARALENDGEQLSRVGTVMGTLRYMSPEQANGIPATTSSDQYSLGVMLYELLTERLPYSLENLSLVAATKVIMDVPAKPPGLDEDLDLILRKSLEKETQLRYASVAAMAEDLRRYQRREAILARPPSFWYALRRTVDRHRLASALVTILVLTMLGGATALAIFNRRLTAERNRAEQAAAFLTRIFENSNPNRSGSDKITAREILDNGAREIETLLASQPDLRAQLTTLIGESYFRLGAQDRAVPTLRAALQAQRQIHGNTSEEALRTTASLAETLSGSGKVKESEPLLREVLGPAIAAHGENNLIVARLRNAYAIVLRDAARLSEALPMAEKSLEVRSRVLGPSSDEALSSANLLGGILSDLQRFEQAEGMLRGVYEARKQKLGERHVVVASSAGSLARLLEQRGKWSEAEALHRETLRIRESLLPEDHPSTSATRSNLASLLQDRGEYAEAEALYRSALQSALRTAGPEARTTSVTLNNLASLLEETERFDEAAQLLERSIGIRTKLYGETSFLVQTAKDNLARVELGRNRLGQCETLLKGILTVLTAPQSRLSPETTLGLLRLKQGRVQEAEQMLRGTYELMQKVGTGKALRRALVDASYAEVLLHQKRYAEALPLLEEAFAIRTKFNGPKSRMTMQLEAKIRESKAKL